MLRPAPLSASRLASLAVFASALASVTGCGGSDLSTTQAAGGAVSQTTSPGGVQPSASGGSGSKLSGATPSGGAIGARGGAGSTSGGNPRPVGTGTGPFSGTSTFPAVTPGQGGNGPTTGPITASGGTISSGTSGGGGTKTTTSQPPVTVSQCGLPTPATSGVAKPTGAAGNLTILNWAGFKGAVTYTFDDGNKTQIDHYAELNALGVPFTFYLQTNKSEASNTIWSQAVKDGHELGNHSQSHAQVGSASDVETAQKFIQSNFGVKAWTLAAPYGDNSYTSIGQASFLVNRGVNNGVVMPNGDANPFNLPCFIPATGASASAFNEQVDKAVGDGGWKIVLVHGFSGGTDGAYQPVSVANFVDSVKHTKSLGNAWIGTMVNVAAYFRAQKLISGVTPTTSGTSKTYSWKLPANFPPGKCLRVTAGGGSVSQSGKDIAWDSHGYYEISLDAGSVTVQ